MNTEIQWDMDLTSGYKHVFLPDSDRVTVVDAKSVNNPSIQQTLTIEQPDAVIIYGYNYRTAQRALVWCVKKSVPALLVSDSELVQKRTLLTRIKRRIVLPVLYRFYSAFLGSGDKNEEQYKHYGVDPERIFRVPFTIDEERYLNARNNRGFLRDEFRQSLGLRNDATLVLSVGKVNDRKRIKDIVAAARLVARNDSARKNIYFIVAGDGERKSVLEEVCREESLNVIFLGFVNVSDLPVVYSGCDILLHPSEKDPHPLALSEASCIGLPLLVSDRVGAVGDSDIAQLGKNCFVFHVGEVETIVERINQLASSPKLLSSMSDHSMKIFDSLDTKKSISGIEAAISACTAMREL